MLKNLHFAIRKIGVGLGLIGIANTFLYAQQGDVINRLRVVSAKRNVNNQISIDTSGKYGASYPDFSTVKVCTNTDPGNNPGDIGCVSFTYKEESVSYSTVRGKDGKIWLQQNLGSTQVATSMSDEESYGDLFQWGRWDDWHQVRNSPTTGTPSPNSPDGLVGISSFITGSWWAGNALTDEWMGNSAASISSNEGFDPCKAIGQEWKMPSQTDWAALQNAEVINNPTAAYNSTLKLPAAGYRGSTTGDFTFVGQRGYYWSSTPSSSGAKYFYIGSVLGNTAAGGPRGQGQSVRCVKETSSLGISETKLNTVGMYPNPTNGILHIKTGTPIESLKVVNEAGQSVEVLLSNNEINMQGFPSGIYIVQLKFKNGQPFFKKIVKK